MANEDPPKVEETSQASDYFAWPVDLALHCVHRPDVVSMQRKCAKCFWFLPGGPLHMAVLTRLLTGAAQHTGVSLGAEASPDGPACGEGVPVQGGGG